MALAAITRTVLDAAGNATSGGSVEIRNEVGGALATLFSDRAGASAIGNPFTAGAAQFTAYMSAGRYRVDITVAGNTATERDIVALDDVPLSGAITSSVVSVASAVSLTNGVSVNVTSISLPAGDYDVNAQVWFVPAATTNHTALGAAISQVSATFPTAMSIDSPSIFLQKAAIVTGAVNQQIPLSTARISLASTTTIYLCAVSAFTVSTMKACGAIWARKLG